jgi:hypothetical protein
MAKADHLKITVDLERDQAEALLRFLRRVGRRPIEAALDASRDDMVRFGQAWERLRVALGKALVRCHACGASAPC